MRSHFFEEPFFAAVWRSDGVGWLSSQEEPVRAVEGTDYIHQGRQYRQTLLSHLRHELCQLR
jgi:hypothetical protein